MVTPIKIGRIPNLRTEGVESTNEFIERREFEREKLKEVLGIRHQPHRTFPAICPKPKPRHDFPVGSYLRYVTDPNVLAAPNRNLQKINEQQVESLLETLSSPDAKFVHLQYNSPIDVYSPDNVRNALKPHSPIHGNNFSMNVLQNSPKNAPIIKDFRASPTYQLIAEREQEEVKRREQEKNRRLPQQSASFYSILK